MVDYKFWLIKIEDHIFWLYLNNPNKKNAFDIAVVNELEQILEDEIIQNNNIRVLVITTSLDDIFTVGLDIKWLVTLDESKTTDMTRNLQKIFSKFEVLPIPVIAAIKGLNLTAGFELMLCADIIIAADNAKFGQVETKWGMTPAAGATQRLTRLIGPMKAKELIYTSRIINAQEAIKIGLINEIVPLAELENRVKDLAKTIIKNSARAIELSKQLIQMGIYNNEDGFQMEGQAFQERFSSGEPKRKLKEFLERS
ncbi:MAG TPA: enoyl-CoA hydratase/isomerase family protein [Candidatus Nanopelagicaceae bacterium]|nr:enoyl-CoA hydratase/isomerase family protein [Candidatus Nanopelagicaceae bacterium]